MVEAPAAAMARRQGPLASVAFNTWMSTCSRGSVLAAAAMVAQAVRAGFLVGQLVGRGLGGGQKRMLALVFRGAAGQWNRRFCVCRPAGSATPKPFKLTANQYSNRYPQKGWSDRIASSRELIRDRKNWQDCIPCLCGMGTISDLASEFSLTVSARTSGQAISWRGT